MRIATGIDIVEIARVRDLLEKHGQRFLDRTFTKGEQEYCMRQSDPAPHLAARWSAKEATAKALGVGIGEELSWQDMEVTRSDRGAPHMQVSSGEEVALSITHSREYAAAIAIITKE